MKQKYLNFKHMNSNAGCILLACWIVGLHLNCRVVCLFVCLFVCWMDGWFVGWVDGWFDGLMV